MEGVDFRDVFGHTQYIPMPMFFKFSLSETEGK